MNPDDRRHAIAARIADGSGIDWATADAGAADADSEERGVLHELKAIAAVAAVHRTPEGWAIDDKSMACQRWGALTLIAPIGEGHFGQVYRAWDVRLQRQVALKVLHATSPSTASSPTRAIEEARLLARVRHSNVLAVYGAECIDEQVGIWTEFIEGRTLESYVAERGPLPADEVVAIGLDLCRALGAVHDAGLLHRDVKAQNVMRETGGRIVLMDFGTGHDLDRRPAQEGDLSGTPLYLAPEVFMGGRASVASDLYALAVLLFYLSTGRHPVPGQTLDDVRAGHQEGAPVRLLDARPDLPDALSGAIERGLAVDPTARYDSAGAFEAALGGVRSPPVEAGSPRPAGWATRPGRVTAVALVAALVVLSGAYARWHRTVKAAVVAFQAAPMSVSRYRHAATLLPDGRVLVTGGVYTPAASPDVATVLASAEIYSPISNTWTPAASMSHARYGHVALLLPTGRVLVAGGFDGPNNSVRTSELYDPISDAWSPAAPLTVPRALPTGNVLADGRVLLTGGFNVPQSDPYKKYLATAEVYDPQANTWTAVPPMSVPRVGHTATRLRNGQVLVVAGANYAYYDSSVQLFDPVSMTWLSAPSLHSRHYGHFAVALPDGRVIIAGGLVDGTFLTNAEIYDPPSNSWSTVPSMKVGRYWPSAVSVSQGRVLVVGGSTASPLTSAEVYDPGTGWSLTSDLGAAHFLSTATALSDGRVLVTGGYDGIATSDSTVVWGPVLSPITALGRYGDATTLTATLRAGPDVTTAGQRIGFTVNGAPVGTAITDANGTATLNGVSLAGLLAGTMPGGVVVTFAGNSQIPRLTGSAALVISKTPITITANDATKTYGAANPAFTVRYGTFVTGDGPSTLDGVLTFKTTATATSPPGAYSVTPGGVTSNNYQINFIRGTLTIVLNGAGNSGRRIP